MALTKTPTTINSTVTASGITNNITLQKSPAVSAGNVMRMTITSGAFEDLTQQGAQELIQSLQTFAATGKLPL